MAKIYVASSWRNSFQEIVVRFLREQGHEVYDFKNPPHGNGGFRWSDIDPNWQNWTQNNIAKPLIILLHRKDSIQTSMACSGRMSAWWYFHAAGLPTQKPDGWKVPVRELWYILQRNRSRNLCIKYTTSLVTVFSESMTKSIEYNRKKGNYGNIWRKSIRSTVRCMR